MKSILLAACCWLGLCASLALATPVITVGNHNLLPNQSGQQVSLFVVGGDLVQGLDLNVQIGDGGAATGGIDTGPALTAIDILTGIFAGNNTGQSDGASALLWNASLTTDVGAVSADGLLAVLTFDTTGLAPGTIVTLSLTPAAIYGGASTFAGLPITINNGTLTLVPEPSMAMLLSVALVATLTLHLVRHARPNRRHLGARLNR